MFCFPLTGPRRPLPSLLSASQSHAVSWWSLIGWILASSQDEEEDLERLRGWENSVHTTKLNSFTLWIYSRHTVYKPMLCNEVYCLTSRRAHWRASSPLCVLLLSHFLHCCHLLIWRRLYRHLLKQLQHGDHMQTLQTKQIQAHEVLGDSFTTSKGWYFVPIFTLLNFIWVRVLYLVSEEQHPTLLHNYLMYSLHYYCIIISNTLHYHK